MNSKQEYVLGFAFDATGDNVVLIKKRKPDFQRDRFNGVGGKIEPGESPLEAMEREFREEAFELSHQHWRLFGTLEGDWGKIYLFSIFAGELAGQIGSRSEPVFNFPVNALPPTILPNVAWMIAMARSFPRGEHALYFEVKEVA